jgi:hypothetical protein
MPTWTLLSYELVLATGTLRTTIRRAIDGDFITRHVDVPQPTGAGWTDADACAAVAAALPAGHVVIPAEPPAEEVAP